MGDAGIKLSGGQRQRIAIARSIVKQPRILIFDEATSAIDVRAEQQVQMALDKVSKNRTTITIAHRLSTIKKADNIVVLRKGKVVQQGTHDDLMAEVGGVYWTLATSQQLSMLKHEDEDHDLEPEIAEKKGEDIILTEESATSETLVGDPDEPQPIHYQRGVFGSFGLFIREQSRYWIWYLVLLAGALVGGGKYTIRTKPSQAETLLIVNHTCSKCSCPSLPFR